MMQKKQKNVTLIKRKKSIPIDYHMTQMLELAEMNFKTTMIKKSDYKMDRVGKYAVSTEKNRLS